FVRLRVALGGFVKWSSISITSLRLRWLSGELPLARRSDFSTGRGPLLGLFRVPCVGVLSHTPGAGHGRVGNCPRPHSRRILVAFARSVCGTVRQSLKQHANSLWLFRYRSHSFTKLVFCLFNLRWIGIDFCLG